MVKKQEIKEDKKIGFSPKYIICSALILFMLFYFTYCLFIRIPEEVKNEANIKCLNLDKGNLERIEKSIVTQSYDIYCSNGNFDDYRNWVTKDSSVINSFLGVMGSIGYPADFEIKISNKNGGLPKFLSG